MLECLADSNQINGHWQMKMEFHIVHLTSNQINSHWQMRMENQIVRLTSNQIKKSVDALGFEPSAFRMRSGCDTTTP